MSSPPPTTTELQPFPSVESVPAVETAKDIAHAVKPPVQDVTTAASQSAESRLIDEARQRLENKCAPDEELRKSLGKMIELCQSLTTRIQTLEPQLLDLQTTLTLTQSNLTLSLANTEMLEDALRSNAQSRDVGWRRSDSASIALQRAGGRPVAASVSYPSAAEQAKIVVQAPSPVKSGASTPAAVPMSPPENRFFKFRFGSKTPSPTSPAYPASQAQPATTHLTSASLPSLGLSIEDEARAKQIEELTTKQESLKTKSSELETKQAELVEMEKKLKAREDEAERALKSSKEKEDELERVKKLLDTEKKTSTELEKEKSRVQDEIETLTQSLFEEANKMVADERRRAAEVEALLRETEEERDAVRGAMRVVEGENGRLRELSASVQMKIEGGGAENGVDGGEKGRTGQEAKDDTSGPAPIPPRPGSSHSSHEGDQSIHRPDEIPTPANGIDSTNPSTDVLPLPIPPIHSSSPDPWGTNGASGSSSPPKTPPSIYALPTETSPWAEGREGRGLVLWDE
ncbi:hypothetical protein FRC12_003426 [Ceratobasidium sp. 428]|nr:hypothetical protein FRC09_020298 [Ceratobasidium sp. 395]KAG8771757.1 hypothetical protein FRC12_003426 [Ceratobasidium sp. 428]